MYHLARNSLPDLCVRSFQFHDFSRRAEGQKALFIVVCAGRSAVKVAPLLKAVNVEIPPIIQDLIKAADQLGKSSYCIASNTSVSDHPRQIKTCAIGKSWFSLSRLFFQGLGSDTGTDAVKLAVVKGSTVQRMCCSVLTRKLLWEGLCGACSDRSGKRSVLSALRTGGVQTEISID